MARFILNIGDSLKSYDEIAGEDLDVGDLVFLAANSKWYKASALYKGTCTTELKLVAKKTEANKPTDLVYYGYFPFKGQILNPNKKYYVSVENGKITDEVYLNSTNLVRYVGTAYDKTTLLFNPDQTYVDGHGTEINEVPIGGIGGLLYKHNVILNGSFYKTDSIYDYFFWADHYIINNEEFTDYISDTVTLFPSDPLLDRIDVIVINNDGTISVIEGEPSTSPVRPKHNELTQVDFTFIYRAAGSVPSSPMRIVYDENLQQGGGEFDTYKGSNNIDLESNLKSYRGSRSILVSNSDMGDSVLFVSPDIINSNYLNTLVLFIYIETVDNYEFKVNLLNEDTLVNNYTIIDGKYGFRNDSINNWQPIIIDLNDNISNFEFDNIEIESKRPGTSFNIDYVFLQNKIGGAVEPVIIEKTSDIPINDGETGDSRYIEEWELEGFLKEGLDTEEDLEFISIKNEQGDNKETIYALRTDFSVVQNNELVLWKANGNGDINKVEENDIVEGFLEDGLVQSFFKGIYLGTGDILDVSSYNLIQYFEVVNNKQPVDKNDRFLMAKGKGGGSNDYPSFEPFITKWNTELNGKTNNNTIGLPLEEDGEYDFIVDWGDGLSSYIRYWNQGETTHIYSQPGEYTITIRGVFKGIVGADSIGENDISKLTEVVQFGDMELGNKGKYFKNAISLQYMASDLNSPNTTNYSESWFNNINLLTFPSIDLSNAINLRRAWRNCKFTEFPLLDTSNATVFEETWQDCTSLESFPLLNTSKGTNFRQAWKGNKSLETFPLLDTSKGTLFNRTWQGCAGFTSFPAIDTGNGKQFQETWNNCSNLTSFPAIDTSKGDRFHHCWLGCRKLESFPELDVSKGKNFQWSFRDIGKENSNNGVLTSFGTYKFDSGDNFRGVFMEIELPTSDYDRILNRLASHNPNTDVNVDYHNANFGNSKYSPNAEAARSYLINDMNWNLVDGGPA